MIDKLMTRGGPIVITEKFITIAANNRNVIKTILSTNLGVWITSRAAVKIVRMCDISIIQLLIAREPTIEITSNVIEAAIGKEDVMQLFFDNDRRIEITAAIVAIRGLLEMVLARHPTINSTCPIPVTGATFEQYRLQIISILVASRPNDTIAEETVRAAVRSDWSAREILQILLATDPAIVITERIVIAAAKNRISCETIAFLLAKYPDIIITERVMIAAAKNRFTSETIALLLAKYPETVITEPILFAAVKNRFSCEIVAILLTRNPDIAITEPILLAAAENLLLGPDMFALLLARKPNMAITKRFLTEVANNVFGSRLLMSLRTMGNITEIPEVATIPAFKLSWPRSTGA